MESDPILLKIRRDYRVRARFSDEKIYYDGFVYGTEQQSLLASSEICKAESVIVGISSQNFAVSIIHSSEDYPPLRPNFRYAQGNIMVCKFYAACKIPFQNAKSPEDSLLWATRCQYPSC